MKKKRRSFFNRPIVEIVAIAISGSLLAASAYMYVNLDRDQLELQAPSKSLLANVKVEPKKKKEENPFVIRNGSNAMPKGMSQTDDDQFMPKWQKDKIKDMSDRGITPEPVPSENNPQGGIAPAVTPAPAQTSPPQQQSPAPTQSAPPSDNAARSQGSGIGPTQSMP